MASLSFQPSHPLFVAEGSGVNLTSDSRPDTFDALRTALNQFAVVILRSQPLTHEQQLLFARQLGGALHEKTGSKVVQKNRLNHDALTDISSVLENGDLPSRHDRRRLYSLGNQLWHTDASFQNPPGRYSILSAKIIPDVPNDTEFADMRAAYDALDDESKVTLANERAHHSIAYSRQTLGFEFSKEEAQALPGAIHPVVRTIPGSGRQSLYLASHASTIIDWPVPEARLMLGRLKEHATQPQFVYRHQWRQDDLVIWDNRATMHRGVPFDDTRHRRELCRVTTLDVD